jgi:hypothetical protein
LYDLGLFVLLGKDRSRIVKEGLGIIHLKKGVRFMTKISLIVLLLSISIGISGKVFANTSNITRAFEEIYPEIGYESVEEALKACEKHFKQDLKLPLRQPPIAFTHQFGRFSNLDGDINDSFEVEFISDQSPENHYIIDVRPAKHRITIPDKFVLKSFKLKNGNVATYINVSGFNVLVFERDHWQYMLNIDKRVSTKVTSEMLVEIANSIDYEPKRRSSFGQVDLPNPSPMPQRLKEIIEFENVD